MHIGPVHSHDEQTVIGRLPLASDEIERCIRLMREVRESQLEARQVVARSQQERAQREEMLQAIIRMRARPPL